MTVITTAKQINHVNKSSSSKKLLIISILLLIITVFLQFPENWLLNGDGSVFWYEAGQILKGKVPYRDLWDHKPPLIYFFNALWLLILPAKVQVLRVVSILLSFGTSFFLYISLRRLFNNFACVLLVVLLVTFYLNDGDVDLGFFYTENLQVFFITISFYFFIKWYQNSKKFDLALTGLFYSLALLTKQSELGLILVVVVIIFSDAWEAKKLLHISTIKSLSWFFIPLLLPAVGFALYLIINNAWNDFLDQNFTYNRVYIAKVTLSSIIFDNLYNLFLNFRFLAVVFILAVFVSLLQFVWSFSIVKLWQKDKFFVLSLIWSVVSFITIDLSGRSYDHYYLQLLVPMTIAVCYFLQNSINFAKHILKINTKSKAVLSLVVVSIISLILFVELDFTVITADIFGFVNEVQTFGKPLTLENVSGTNAYFDVQGAEISEYLHNQDKNLNNQTVYVWGHGTQILFYIGTSSPSKFIYNLPLLTPGYGTPEMRNEFMQTLEKNPPAYFLDTGFPDYIFPTQIDPDTIDDYISHDALNYPFDPAFRKQLQDFLNQNYVLDKIFNQGNYTQTTVYRLKKM